LLIYRDEAVGIRGEGATARGRGSAVGTKACKMLPRSNNTAQKNIRDVGNVMLGTVALQRFLAPFFSSYTLEIWLAFLMTAVAATVLYKDTCSQTSAGSAIVMVFSVGSSERSNNHTPHQSVSKFLMINHVNFINRLLRNKHF
jgi:hypothetical protein